MKRAYLSTIASMEASFPPARRLTILPQLEITVNHLIGWSANPAVSAWHGLHGHRYDFNAHPFTIAGCLVSRHIDKSKKMPTGHPKAALAWAIGPSPNHYRNFRILVKEGKGQCGIQDENQLDFHLPAHVQVHRLPYHAELAAAIKDLTTVLKKTPPTEATGTPTSDDIASLGQSLLEAATHAHRIFGTPQPVAPMHIESDDRYDPHYNQSLSTPEEPMEYKTQPPIANQHLPSIPSPIPKPVHPAPIVPTPPAVQQRVVATPLPATPPAPRQRVVATPTTPRAQLPPGSAREDTKRSQHPPPCYGSPKSTSMGP